MAVALQLSPLCFDKPENLREVIRLECGEALKKAGEYDTCVETRDKVQTARDRCSGALRSKEEDIRVRNVLIKTAEQERDTLRKELDDRWSWLTWFLIGAGTVVVGAGTTAIVFR